MSTPSKPPTPGSPGDPPRDPNEDRLLEHDVDGIREYDNPMPRWWLWILWASIVWALLYAANLIPGVGSGRGFIANYEAEAAKAASLRAEEKAAAPSVSAEAILAAALDPAKHAQGLEVWTTNCVPCHLDDGGGSIGPNLTDDFWIHGPQPLDLYTTVNLGVLDKGMPAWGEVLKPEDVIAVVAYVTTLHGTHPKEAKEPQGTHYEYEHGRPESAESHDHASHSDSKSSQ